MKIDEKNYKEIAEFIHSDESPVGIDAKKNAHLHYPQAQSNRNTLRSSRSTYRTSIRALTLGASTMSSLATTAPLVALACPMFCTSGNESLHHG